MTMLFLLLSLFSPQAVRADNAALVPEEMLNLRDPFKRPLIVQEKVEPKTELEAYPADQYKMIGVITGLNNLRAIVSDPDGKTHFVSEGLKMGTRKGIVKKITNDSIKVREKMVNVVGQEENVDIEIRLPAEDNHASAAELNASEVIGQSASAHPASTPVPLQPAQPYQQQAVQPVQLPVYQQPVVQTVDPVPAASPAASPAVGSPFISPIFKKSFGGG